MRSPLKKWRPMVDDAIESLLPRNVDHAYLSSFYGSPEYEYDEAAIQRALSDPAWDLLDRGGKRWRSSLFLLFVEAFGEDPEDYLEYAVIPEVLHNGTLIVDDIQDGGDYRRGGPALHRVYGTDVGLNAGTALYFLPLAVVSRNPGGFPPEVRLAVYEMLVHELNRAHLGQGMDVRWHNHEEIDVSEPEYFEMSACKTGSLGRIAAKQAAILTDSRASESAVAAFAEKTGVAFQIVDDVLDIEYALQEGGRFGKDRGNDIQEGKKTLLVIHAAEHAPAEDVARLERILDREENTPGEIRQAVDILEDAGSIDYARRVAREFAEVSTDHLGEADLEPDAADRLSRFPEFVMEREA
jgi:geranylgeranyl diphosphate synthase type I